MERILALSDSEAELLRSLSEAEEDVRAGRIAPIEDTFDGIRELLFAQKQAGR